MGHAVIYNKNYMEKAIEYYAYYSPMVPNDILSTKLKGIKCYGYYKPLIYQTFPITESQINGGWDEEIKSKFLLYLALKIIKILKLDKQIQPGYTIMYSGSYLFYLVILVVLYIILKRLLKGV